MSGAVSMTVFMLMLVLIFVLVLMFLFVFVWGITTVVDDLYTIYAYLRKGLNSENFAWYG
jgi:predicted PurR-regulated permease PerM